MYKPYKDELKRIVTGLHENAFQAGKRLGEHNAERAIEGTLDYDDCMDAQSQENTLEEISEKMRYLLGRS